MPAHTHRTHHTHTTHTTRCDRLCAGHQVNSTLSKLSKHRCLVCLCFHPTMCSKVDVVELCTLSLSVSPHMPPFIGPPSRSDKSPQYSASHSHSPPHATNEHTKETLSSPDATPPTPRKDGRSHPLLPTPIGPPPVMRGVGDSPTQYPLKSPTPAGLPVGGMAPFSVRSPRPPLLSTPPYATTVPQPHMAILVWREGWDREGRGQGPVVLCMRC